MPVQRFKSIRGRVVTAAVVVLALLGILAPDAHPTAASTVPTCAERVVADWSDDGLIAGKFEIACYRDALKILPEDVLIYSSALDDISRAMREALDEQRGTATAESGASRRLSGRGQPAADERPEAATEATPALVPDDSSTSRSLPLPLLLMAVLTLVLVLAGTSSLLAKRLRRR